MLAKHDPLAAVVADAAAAAQAASEEAVKAFAVLKKKRDRDGMPLLSYGKVFVHSVCTCVCEPARMHVLSDCVCHMCVADVRKFIQVALVHVCIWQIFNANNIDGDGADVKISDPFNVHHNAHLGYHLGYDGAKVLGADPEEVTNHYPLFLC